MNRELPEWQAMDAAIRTWIAAFDPDQMAIGWVLCAGTIPMDLDGDIQAKSLDACSEDLVWHARLGLLVDAQNRLLRPEGNL